MNSEQFLAAISDCCDQALTEAQFRPVYTRVFTPDTAILDLIRALKPLCKVGLIAETSHWRFEDGLHPLDIFPLLDAVSLSWELGGARPVLWQDALAKLGIMAEECAYVDARSAFALAATGNLLHGLPYSNPEALQAALRRLKIRL